jgi:photosystem II stability/assembly factor-like uncharacterized protein
VRDNHPQRLRQRKAVLAILGVCVVALAAALFWGAPGRAAQRVTRQLFGVQETSGQWVNIGPAPNMRGATPAPASGRVAAIAVDPTSASHWLVGVGNGGVWETRDTGRTWAAIADAAPTLATGAVAFAPSNPNIIYAGTGEAIQVVFAHSGVGILKSTDGGASWTLLGASAFSRMAVKRLRVHPTNPNIVIAASSSAAVGRDGSSSYPRAASGIWKSTDGGITWARKLSGEATALEVDPVNFNNQYAAIGEKAPAASGSLPNGLYRSSDGGDTWTLVAGPWGASTLANPVVGRIELAMAPSNPNVVYAGIQRYPVPVDTGLLGLYRTDTAFSGTPTWIRVPTTQVFDDYCSSAGNGDIEVKCGYSHVLTVDPLDPNRLFAGGRTLWRCTNCAGSPTWANTHFYGADYHATAWAGTRLIAGNDYGVYSTTNFGTPMSSWEVHNSGGLSTGMFYKGALHPSDPGFIVGGFRDFSTVVQRDGSPIWRAVGGGGEGEIAISTSRPTTDWMMSFRYIRRTTDGGVTITPADAGIDWSRPQFVPPVRKCPSNDNFFLAGTDRIWRIADFFSSTAPTWASNSPPGDRIQSIVYAPDDATCNSYAYGTNSGRVLMTRNGGSTWTDLDPGRAVPPRAINWLAFEPGNSSVIYAAISNFDNASPGRSGHVFKATNVGANAVWRNISPPSDTAFNVVAIDPRNTQRVYAGSDLGLWHSNDGGANWIKDGLAVGLPNVSVYDIQINPTTNRTVIFTYGRGAYVLTP